MIPAAVANSWLLWLAIIDGLAKHRPVSARLTFSSQCQSPGISPAQPLMCECNGSPLGRYHHRAKQTHGWRLDQQEPGVMGWTVPSGRRYVTTPTTHPL